MRSSRAGSARGEITALEVTEECLRRIDAGNPRLNAFILVRTDQARAEARDADRELAAGRDRGPLHGVPISIKDLLDLRGTPTTAASRVRDGHLADRDAAAIARLRQAGRGAHRQDQPARVRVRHDERGIRVRPARNPHDPARSPGGSSGGSAASVAAGMALASIGTDTGGSIRIPAAACGVVGLKPTYGEVPVDGVVPLSRTLDHVGPLARSVTDALFVYRALIGDKTPRPPVGVPVRGLRLALPRRYFCDVLDDEVRARFEGAIDRLRAEGARVDEIDIHHADQIAPIYLHIVLADAAAFHATILDTRPEQYTPSVRVRLEAGRHVLAEDYVRALNGRELLRREVDAALAGHNALVLPALAIPAPPLGAESVQVGSTRQPVRSVMLRLTQLFNLTGHPAMSLPCGQTSSGLPCGLQLVGPRDHTAALLRVALACESIVAPSPYFNLNLLWIWKLTNPFPEDTEA